MLVNKGYFSIILILWRRDKINFWCNVIEIKYKISDVADNLMIKFSAV